MGPTIKDIMNARSRPVTEFAPTSDILIIGYDNTMSWKGFRNLNAKSLYYQGVPFLKVDRVHNKPVVLAFLLKVCNTKQLEMRG